MALRQIPRQQWDSFLKSFSDQHQDWLVTLEQSDGGESPQVTARDVPLAMISHDPADKAISITLGGPQSDRIDQHIPEPTEILLEETDKGAHQALHISGEAQKLILRFRSTVLPEMVDGIA